MVANFNHELLQMQQNRKCSSVKAINVGAAFLSVLANVPVVAHSHHSSSFSFHHPTVDRYTINPTTRTHTIHQALASTISQSTGTPSILPPASSFSFHRLTVNSYTINPTTHTHTIHQALASTTSQSTVTPSILSPALTLFIKL